MNKFRHDILGNFGQMLRSLFIVLFLFCICPLWGQVSNISGIVSDQQGVPIAAVNVSLPDIRVGTSTDDEGKFSLRISAQSQPLKIRFSHVSYETQEVVLDTFDGSGVRISMIPKVELLDEVAIEAEENTDARVQVSVTKIDPKTARLLPSAFGDFNKVLATLPGVSSNNELSASYSVRGGNFDENLVYVNGMPIYRPFLIRAGQQEGLSFVNPDLVDNIQFSSGGWEAKYGDKLSSNLAINYKKPEGFAGSATLSLLGAAFHLEAANKNQRINYLLGVRHKSSQYLLNTLETEGEYLPKFTDIQAYINFDLNKSTNSPKTNLELLFSYARNRYLVRPKNRITRFGTLSRVFRLFVAFAGQEQLEYDTFQGGLKLNHYFNDRLSTHFILSGLFTREQENFDIEGGYRLCDVDNNISSSTFNGCAVTRGIGTNYGFARNSLEAQIGNLENQWVYSWHDNHLLEFGVGYSKEQIDDQLNEYAFTDSANFVSIDAPPLNTTIDLNSYRFNAYLQQRSFLGEVHSFTYGVRFNYWSFNGEWLISPRIQYAIQPKWHRDVVFKAAFGWYRQPPFYRELRDFNGVINDNLKAQSSVHSIVGLDYNFKIWGRNFKFITEAYYKDINRAIAYDVDNVRIRYYANNDTKAYATGIDFRVSGEFIPDAQSWFSLGLLQTREDLGFDDQGEIPRPTDQTVNLGIFFQDHIPNDPTLKVSLNLLYGSGLPFGPPNELSFRNAFEGDSYNRVDIGFSKLITFEDGKSPLKTLWLGVEVLNLLGARNTISYTWIKDVNNQQFGVPNTLSQRFFNLKAQARF
ncbi:MAG: TonB-dependent receptor [Cyclobacteriaceae bacterium]